MHTKKIYQNGFNKLALHKNRYISKLCNSVKKLNK